MTEAIKDIVPSQLEYLPDVGFLSVYFNRRLSCRTVEDINQTIADINQDLDQNDNIGEDAKYRRQWRYYAGGN